MRTVLPIYTKVKFGKEKEFVGQITKLILTEHETLYGVSYWMEDEFKCIELPESELALVEFTTKIKIGFDAIKSN